MTICSVEGGGFFCLFCLFIPQSYTGFIEKFKWMSDACAWYLHSICYQKIKSLTYSGIRIGEDFVDDTYQAPSTFRVSSDHLARTGLIRSCQKADVMSKNTTQNRSWGIVASSDLICVAKILLLL